MLKFILALIFCLISSTSFAFSEAFFQAVSTTNVQSSDYTDILFWWRAESATLAAGDYPASGTLTANNASATISSSASYVGTNGVSSVAAYAYYYKAVTSGDLINPAVGRVGFWFKYNTTYQARTLFRYYVNGTNMFYVIGVTGGNIKSVYQSGGTNSTAQSAIGTLVADTWYYLEATYDTTNHIQKVYINGSEVATATLNLAAISNTGQIQIGESQGSATPNEFIDNIAISNITTRDFYGGGTGLCVSTSSPR